MKKVLILSYHSLPFDAIASYRANAYLKHFKQFGFEPTLLTHYAGMESKMEVSAEEYDYGKVIRIPVKKSVAGRITDFLENIPYVNKPSILGRWLTGFLDPRSSEIDSYFSMKAYCFNELAMDRFDVVMGIFSPHHHLRLCYVLHRKFKIPYIPDFRDLWDNRVMHKKYQPNLTERIQDGITKYYWRKWLSGAEFFTITSNPWREKINEFSRTNGYVVTNGFDSEYSDQVKHDKKTGEFVVLHTGSLYEHQDLEIFLEGSLRFIESQKPSDFKVKFIGADRSYGQKKISGFMHNPKGRVAKFLSESFCELTRRVPKIALIKEFNEARLLLFPSFPDSPGTYAGKIFDYLAAKKPILMVPDDHDVVSELIKETGSGVIKNTPEEVAAYLQECYAEWKKHGRLAYHGVEDTINKYSRESQVKKMATLLLSTLEPNQPSSSTGRT